MAEAKVVATYEMIKAFYNQPSNKWLALAEFIDNSISSWQNKNPNADIYGLVINIVYDSRDSSNKKLIIEDNANGMNEEELLCAMQPHNRVGKSSTDYNQYGVGMKFGCFWNGQDATIYSKKNNFPEYYVSLKTSKKNSSEEAVFHSYVSINTQIPATGTKIVIENLYDNRSLKSNDIDEIKKALGWRYNKLINAGLIITIKEIKADKNFKEDTNIKIAAFENEPYNFKVFLSEMKKKVDNIQAFEKSCEDKVREILLEAKPSEKIKKLFCEKFLNKEDLVGEIKVNVNNDNLEGRVSKYLIKNEKPEEEYKYNATLKFGILSTKLSGKYAERCGLSTYHIKRAINHGPNITSKSIETNYSNTISFSGKSKSSGANPTWRRLYGEIDLSGIETPDQNKGRFNWSLHGEEDVKSILSVIWDELIPLLNVMVESEKLKKAEVVVEEKKIEKIAKLNESIMNNDLISFSIDKVGEQSCVLYQIKDTNKKIRIIERNKSDEGFISISSNEKDVVSVTTNVDHRIWKPFINNRENLNYRATTVYPIVLVIVICNEYMKNNSDWKDIFEQFFSNEGYEVFEVINELMKVLVPEKEV